jgi:hypothetical protein
VKECAAVRKRFLFCVFLAAGCQSVETAARPIAAGICQVLDRPSDYEGKIVRVRAEVFADFREFSGLRDADCASTWLPFAAAKSTPQGNEELEEVLRTNSESEHGVAIATITGRVRAQPGQVPSVVVEVERFESIEQKDQFGGN